MATAAVLSPTDPTVSPAVVNPVANPPAQKSVMQLAAEQVARDNTVTPVLNTFDESKGVAGRVADITSQDSPLMSLAKTRGTQLAASRGLTNSTLAGEAEQNSVLAAATPIATSDASLYQQVQQANQQASNNASTTNATLGVQAGTAGLNLTQQQEQIDAQKEQFAQSLGLQAKDLDLRRDALTQDQQQKLDQLNLQKAQLAQQNTQFGQAQGQQATQFAATQQQQLTMQSLDQANKIAVANIEATYKNELQSNINLTSSWQSMMNNIQAIQNNANLDGPAKATLVQNALDAFSSYAKYFTKTTGVDTGPLLDFGTVAPGQTVSPGAAPNTNAGSTPGAGNTVNPVYTPPPTGFNDPGVDDRQHAGGG